MSIIPGTGPVPIIGFDPFHAPVWVQPYLDCTDGILAQGIGGRSVLVTMMRGDAVVGEVVVEVPEGAEELEKQRRRKRHGAG